MAFMWLALAGALGQSGGTSAGAVQRVLNAPEEDQRATPSVDVPSPSLKETTSGEVGLVCENLNNCNVSRHQRKLVQIAGEISERKTDECARKCSSLVIARPTLP